jgi:hypothetical protein
MENLIIAVIVALALFFTIRRFVNQYKKKESSCCGGCSCDAQKGCAQDTPFTGKNFDTHGLTKDT